MWNLRNKTKDQSGEEERGGRDQPRNRLLTMENKLMVIVGQGGRGNGEIGDGDEGVHFL